MKRAPKKTEVKLAKEVRLRLHTHPQMERDLRIPSGHVIIDADVFMELFRKHGPYVPIERRGV